MPVAAADLIQPVGELEAELWPGLSSSDLTDRLDAYIEAGMAAAAALDIDSDDEDAAVTAYAYWRAYDSVAQRLTATPASQDVPGQASRSYNIQQAQMFAARAAAKKAQFEGYAPPESGTQPEIPPTGSMAHETTW